MNEDVTMACSIAARIFSKSLSAPLIPAIFDRRAPAKESPHPVGSITSSTGKAGRAIIPHGRWAKTPEEPLLITSPLGPRPADSPPCKAAPESIGEIAFVKILCPDMAHTSYSFRMAMSAFLSARESCSNSVSIHNIKVSTAVISALGH